MDNTLSIGLAAQSALKRQLDVLAHNVANVNTTSFKKETVLFREYLMDIGGENVSTGGKISTVLDFGVVRDLTEGSMKPTGNPLDIAISGNAYLSVIDEAGTVHYTRNGRMSINDRGELATLDGRAILDDANRPIILNADDTELSFTESGALSSAQRPIAQLGIFTFDDERSLKKVGDSLYATEQDPLVADNYKIIQGSIEGSNVNAVKSMTEMINISRSYESLTRSIGKIQEMRKDSLNRLARVQ